MKQYSPCRPDHKMKSLIYRKKASSSNEKRYDDDTTEETHDIQEKSKDSRSESYTIRERPLRLAHFYKKKTL